MLKGLNKYLVENKYQSTFELANENIFYDRLLIQYFAVINGQNTYWPIEIGKIPFGDDSLNGLTLLQIYTPIVGDISVNNYLPTCDIVAKINPKLTLGCFGFLDSHKLIFFKHNIIFSDQDFDHNCVIIDKTLSIMFYMLENFQKALVDVAHGKSTVDDAMDEMPLNYIYK